MLRTIDAEVPRRTRPHPPVAVTAYGCDPDEARQFRELAPASGVVPTWTSLPVTLLGLEVIPPPASRCISVDHRHPLSGTALGALAAAGVELVSSRSIGLDHIDTDAARRIGIEVRNTLYAPDGVAEFTVMLILRALRSDLVRDAGRGRELRGLTVGVIGTGRIGTAVAERLHAFGCRVLGHDLRTIGAEHVPLEQLLRESDVVTLHLPLASSTRRLLDPGRIAMMKPDAVLVNTARAGLVDTAALVDALETGRLGGAALDIDDDLADPLLARLRRLPNVTLTPHVAYRTLGALRDTIEATLVQVRRFEESRRA